MVLADSNGGLIASGVVWFIVAVIVLIGFWKVLEKMGESGAWSLLLLTGCFSPFAFLPILKRVGRPAWWVVLLYIPIVNFVVLAIVSIELAKSFDRSTAYGIGLWLLSPIFYVMLGYGPAQYQGPAAVAPV